MGIREWQILFLVLAMAPIVASATIAHVTFRKLNELDRPRRLNLSELEVGLDLLALSILFGLFNSIAGPQDWSIAATGITRDIGWIFVMVGLYKLFVRVDKVL